MYTNIDILKDDVKYGKFDQIIDLLFCISSVIFAFAIPFQFKFTPWIAHWFFAVLIFKIYYVLRGKEKIISFDIKDSIAILSLGLFGLWALLSTFWSLNPEHTYLMVIAWLPSLLIVPGIYVFSSKRLPIILMQKSYTLGCTALISYLLIDLMRTALDGNILFYIYPRLAIMNHIAAISYHHIYLGFTIIISIFISIKFFFEKETKSFEKIYYIIHTIMALFLLAIDNSRIIFFVLFITTLIFTINKINKGHKVILPIAILFLLVIVTCVLPTRTNETISNIISNGYAKDPRFEIWKAILPGIKDVPLLGYGYQAVDSIYTDLYTKAECWFALNYHYISHNQFIESYFNLGIVGLILSIMILLGFWKIIKMDKTIVSIGTFILLLVSMIFDVPFFHCLVTPLLLSWIAFSHSAKENINVNIPSNLYIIITSVVAGIFIFTTINASKAIKKYSSKQEIEMADFSQRIYTKKALKKHKIKDDNIYLIFSGGKNEFINEHYDKLIDKRFISLIKTSDTLVCSFEYYVSDDYNGDNINITTEYSNAIVNINLNKRNKWESEQLIIPPIVNYISTSYDGQKSIIYNEKERKVMFNATYMRNCGIKGYTLLRNLKITKQRHK